MVEGRFKSEIQLISEIFALKKGKEYKEKEKKVLKIEGIHIQLMIKHLYSLKSMEYLIKLNDHAVCLL